MKEEIDYLRQSGIIDIKKFRDNNILIVGCGAIGSFVAISLAKMGLTKFTLCDADTVEEHNLPNQFFTTKDVTRPKVNATSDNMFLFNPKCEIRIINDVFKTVEKAQIVISCVDNMEVRKQIFKSCKKDKKVQLFIDARMGGLEGQVYLVNMTKKDWIKDYEKSLFESKSAVKLRCTERSIIFTVLGIASIVCDQIVKALKGDNIRNYLVLDYNVPQLF